MRYFFRRRHLVVMSALAVAFFPVVTGVSASTTIGTNISTGGSLNVSGSSTLSDLTVTGTCTGCGGGSPAGSAGQIQFNAGGGAFGASANFLWDSVASALIVNNAPAYSYWYWGMIDPSNDTVGAIVGSNAGSALDGFVAERDNITGFGGFPTSGGGSAVGAYMVSNNPNAVNGGAAALDANAFLEQGTVGGIGAIYALAAVDGGTVTDQVRGSAIGTEEVQTFLNAKHTEGLSWWTRKAMQAVISSIFTKAEDWGYREGRNPARRTTLGRKKPKREKRILTDKQLSLLLAAVPEYVRLMIETAVSTGMRISEIVGLRWRYVDLTLGIIKVEERFYRGETGEPKSERARRILPLGLLTDRYKQHRPANAAPDQYVFDDSGEPMDDRTILRNVIRPAAKRIGFYFEGFGWHSFRRQNITVLQEEGATAFEAMAQAGHSRPSMTGEYTIVGFERREQAVRRLQERLQLGRQPVSLGVN